MSERKLSIVLLSKDTPSDFSNFQCGAASLDLFTRGRLVEHHSKGFLKAYILFDKDTSEIIGYYTLSSSHFEREDITSRTQQKKVPYNTVASVTLGRLAVISSEQRKGYGELLVTHAMRTVYDASMKMGIYALFVQALNDKAEKFYINLGFTPLKRVSQTTDVCLFYPVGSITKLFNEP